MKYPLVQLNFSRFAAVCVMVCCLVWLVSCQVVRVHQGEEVKVVRVVSGQTIEVLDGNNPLAEQVRLLGIEAPNWQEQKAWSAAAKKQLAEWIELGSTVRLETDVQPYYIGKDGAKLRLAYLWLDRQLLNEKLVAGGYVLAQSRLPNYKYEQRLAYAQEQARLLGLGIWNLENPMQQHPNEFDKQ